MRRRARHCRFRAFAYRNNLWHSKNVEFESCQHTIYHVDADGFLQGSWTTQDAEDGTRVVCVSCGKFYGYLREGTLPPIKRPRRLAHAKRNQKTGSSSCSAPSEADRPELNGTLPKCPVDSADVPTKKSARPDRRRAIDFAALRRLVTIGQVLQLIEFTPRSRAGSQLRGPCPVHRSTGPKSRIFSVNLERNIYRCFKPACDSKGNQLDLYVAVTGLPLYEAAIELCEKLGIDVPWKEGEK